MFLDQTQYLISNHINKNQRIFVGKIPLPRFEVGLTNLERD